MEINGWKAIYIAAVCMVIVGLMGIVMGNYLLTLLMLGAAIAMYFIGKNEKKKAERLLYKQDNPHSTNLPVLYDDKILNLLEADKQFDPTNIKLENLQQGFLLDYNLQNWSIFQVAIDYWKEGNLANTITKRAVLKGVEETNHLTIDKQKITDDYPLTKNVNIYTINKEIEDYAKNGKLNTPSTLVYHGETYYKEPVNVGVRINPDDKTFQSIESVDYLTEDRKKIIQLQLLGGVDLDAFAGEMIDDRKFGNILPA